MWERWNQSTKIFEKSTNNGASWTPLGLDASIITQGVIDSARLPPYPPSSGGDVVGPASASAGSVPMFANTTGKLLADTGLNISNIARRDAANTFTSYTNFLLPPSIISDYPYILFRTNTDPVDSHDFYIENWAQQFRIAAYNEDRSVLSGQVTISRTGILGLPGGLNLPAGGTLNLAGGNNNNVALAGSASDYAVSAAAGAVLTGMTPRAAGHIVVLVNAGAQQFTTVSQSTASTAGWRFAKASTIPIGGIAVFVYFGSNWFAIP